MDKSRHHLRPRSELVLCLGHNCFQIGNTAVGKNNQLPVSMDIATFDEPGLTRPLERRHRFVIERHREVIDALVAGGIVVRITEKVLDSRANPAFFVQMVRRERRDPFSSVAGVTFIVGARDNLRPLIIVLHVQRGRDVKIAQVGDALHPLHPRA